MPAVRFITVQGDTIWSGGVFNANTSSMTLQGNLTKSSPLVFNYGTSTINLSGTSKTLSESTIVAGVHYWNLNISGSITLTNGGPDVHGTSNISGTLSLGNNFTMISGSTLTVSGTINGGDGLFINSGAVLGTGGTLSAETVFFNYSGIVPARVYSGLVSIEAPAGGTYTATLAAGTHSYNGGLQIAPSGRSVVTVDASALNPTKVTVTTLTFPTGNIMRPTTLNARHRLLVHSVSCHLHY